MQPLASQTSPSSLDSTTVSRASRLPVPAPAGISAALASNDNADGWKPTLLVQRRRRLNRRAGRI
jgi:hypothetical protein